MRDLTAPSSATARALTAPWFGRNIWSHWMRPDAGDCASTHDCPAWYARRGEPGNAGRASTFFRRPPALGVREERRRIDKPHAVGLDDIGRDLLHHLRFDHADGLLATGERPADAPAVPQRICSAAATCTGGMATCATRPRSLPDARTTYRSSRTPVSITMAERSALFPELRLAFSISAEAGSFRDLRQAVSVKRQT